MVWWGSFAKMRKLQVILSQQNSQVKRYFVEESSYVSKEQCYTSKVVCKNKNKSQFELREKSVESLVVETNKVTPEK